jgi:predicted dehydrogenase
MKYPEEMEITAIADTRPLQLEAANRYLNLPEDRLFDGIESLLAQPRLADVLIIATPDKCHRDHAVAAMAKGYHLLLEKPIANNLIDCKEIVEAARKYDRKIMVCHVLRYTVFYQQIKKLIDEGAIGKVQNIVAEERIGYYHFAHSYVRGNWHKLADSSPIILAKCSHDMDLMLWLTGKKCKKVTSFGSLDYFTKENCPEGAPLRCSDGCPYEDCPYHAVKFYNARIPGWPASILHPEPTEEKLLPILQTTDYGKCVFQSDNDVVDHQVVNMLMEDGVTVSFTMSAFNGKIDRGIHVMGTKGEIVGEMDQKLLTVRTFGMNEQHSYSIDLDALCDDFTGHGGGDARMIYDVIRFVRGDEFDTSAITTIERSAESHYVAFAAEASRLAEGQVIDMDRFVAEH